MGPLPCMERLGEAVPSVCERRREDSAFSSTFSSTVSPGGLGSSGQNRWGWESRLDLSGVRSLGTAVRAVPGRRAPRPSTHLRAGSSLLRVGTAGGCLSWASRPSQPRAVCFPPSCSQSCVPSLRGCALLAWLCPLGPCVGLAPWTWATVSVLSSCWALGLSCLGMWPGGRRAGSLGRTQTPPTPRAVTQPLGHLSMVSRQQSL